MKNIQALVSNAVASARNKGLTIFGFEPEGGTFPEVLKALATQIRFNEEGQLKTTATGKPFMLTVSSKSTFDVKSVERINGDKIERFGLFSVIFEGDKVDGVEFPEFSVNVTGGTLAVIGQNSGTFQALAILKEYKVRQGRNAGQVRDGMTIEAAKKVKEENAFSFVKAGEVVEVDSQKKASNKTK